MFVSALPDPTCNSEKSANGGNKHIIIIIIITDLSQRTNVQSPESASSENVVHLPLVLESLKPIMRLPVKE